MKADLKVETFKRCWLFSDLSARAVEQIAQLSTVSRFSKNQMIFQEGDPSDFLYVVGSGKVKQFKSSGSGKIFTTVISTSGNALLPIALFGSETFFLSAQAINDTVIYVISKRQFLSFIEKYPIVKDRMLFVMGKVIDSAYERLCDFVGETASRRVLNVLYMLYSKFGDAVSFNREELADMAGTTVETTVRVLRELKASRIVESRRGCVVILDHEELRRTCRSSYVIPTA
jgi:CRP/FNR family transcriptional regulator, nitrogen oxide reductase regulator